MFKHAILLSLLLSLTACSGGGSKSTTNTTSPTSPNGTAALLPPEPDRIENNKTLEGIDSDGDGVRDDVQRLIFKTYTSTVKRALSLAYAKETRKKYISPPSTTQEARKMVEQIHKVADCIYSKKGMSFDDRSALIDLLVASHADTSARMKAYLSFDRLLHGESFSLPISDIGLCEGIFQ